MQPVTVTISSETIKLGQFIKLASLVETGGAAKEVIADGRVRAAGTLEEVAAGYANLEEAFFSLTAPTGGEAGSEVGGGAGQAGRTGRADRAGRTEREDGVRS